MYGFGSPFAEVVKACAGGPLVGVACSSDSDCPISACTGVLACASGPLQGMPCISNMDCTPPPPNTTTLICAGTTITGVSFPQDIRTCTLCHSQGADAGNYLTKASTSAGCHCHGY